MNQRGFTSVVILLGLVVVLAGALGYVTLSKKPAPVVQSQATDSLSAQPTNPSPTPAAIRQGPPVMVSQLTKAQVLNGYDQCGNQFVNGEFSFPGGYDAWNTWDLSRHNQGEVSCPENESLIPSGIQFADLDGDGINEAVVPARDVTAASGGVLYVFKNVDGTARIVASATIGIEDIEITSITGNTIVGKTDGQTPVTLTYKFTNDTLVQQ